MEFCLFLGCNTPAVRPDVERAIRASMKALDVDLVDADNYVCCPAFGAFPSTDEDSWLATSGWNLSIAEQKKRDILVQCGSCYSSLRMGREHIMHDEEKKTRVNELLEPTGRTVEGGSRVRHVSEVLYKEITPEVISQKVKCSLEGLHGIVQYPCHTLYPSEVVGFEDSPREPKGMRQLVEALGAEVDSYSKEMPVSCITCLMHMENVQNTINERIGEEKYKIPIFDYNQLLALCLGEDPKEVSAIANVSRDKIHDHIAKVTA